MHKALRTRDNVDRLHVSRKEGGRGFANIEDCLDALIQRRKDYIKSVAEDGLQRPETTLTTKALTEQK